MSKDMLTLFFSVFLTLFFIYPFQTIISNPIAGTASATPNPICSGANTTLTLTGYSGTIQWYSSANNTTFTIINGTLYSASYTTGGLTATTYYYAIVTQGSGAGSTSTSDTTTVTVESLPSITITPNQANICAGNSVRLTSNLGNQCGKYYFRIYLQIYNKA